MAITDLGARLAGIIRRVFGRSARPGRRTPASSGPEDFSGIPKISYRPNPGNGKVADPGEIVWTWVPFEEDHRQGKDRPVLVIGRDGPWLLALSLTSKDHRSDAIAHPHALSRWTDIGSGPWDRRGRPSAVRVDRVLRVDPAGVRREGAVLDKRRFNQVAAAVRSAA
ncbi:MAG: type II toxin-antitoxin system PemK/MazF family toxin [Dermatophilaceae bacterium]|nr:type II toxin-antitoxin system PemK/MazF family toxin [Dermatophilaceae bacterium]